MTERRAFITGITGQDGSYLAELLVAKGYEVHGLVRRTSQPSLANLAAIQGELVLHSGDMTDGASLARAIATARPHEIYNLAAMSQVRESYEQPEATQDINAVGLLRLLEAVRATDLDCRIYQACSSEMFGEVRESPQSERTPFNARSPYGASKVAAYSYAKVWREAYGMHIACGILFNHESPRRGETFLSRKVCKAAAEIAVGMRDSLVLGNLEAQRDWGYAKEYAAWIHAILQHDEPTDFVIATGETHSVREFVEAAFAHAGIADWERHVAFDRQLTRPAEVDVLRGDASKSRALLGFEPQVKFRELVAIMVDAELAKLRPRHSDERRDLEGYPEAKVLRVKRDTVLGRHYHLRKQEQFILSAGAAFLHLGGGRIPMEIGRIYTVRPGEPHAFEIVAGSVLVGLNSLPYDPSDDYEVEA
jgi:GDPmannose 4,6-dehydratase